MIKEMTKEITKEHFIMLVAVLFILYFVMNIKETFDQIMDKPVKRSTKSCSQKEINAAYNDYVFGGTKFIR